MTHEEFHNPVQIYKRMTHTRLAYDVDYNEVTGSHIVTIFSVQRGRSKAFLGEIALKNDEWKLFHETVYLNWERLEEGEPSKQ